jgi:hypothetical protein
MDQEAGLRLEQGRREAELKGGEFKGVNCLVGNQSGDERDMGRLLVTSGGTHRSGSDHTAKADDQPAGETASGDSHLGGP